MTEEQLTTFMKWVEAKIDEKLRQQSGMDSGAEYLSCRVLEGELRNLFDWRQL